MSVVVVLMLCAEGAGRTVSMNRFEHGFHPDARVSRRRTGGVKGAGSLNCQIISFEIGEEQTNKFRTWIG